MLKKQPGATKTIMSKMTAAEFKKIANKGKKETDIQGSMCKNAIWDFLVIRFNSGIQMLSYTKVKSEVETKRCFRAYFIKNLPGPDQSRGLADFAIFRDGKCWFFEVKKPKGSKMEDSQIIFRELCKKFRMPVYKVDNLDDFLNILKTIN